jgi:hypothetical protein
MSYPFGRKAGKICLYPPPELLAPEKTKILSFCEATASLMQEFIFWHIFQMVTNKDNRE